MMNAQLLFLLLPELAVATTATSIITPSYAAPPPSTAAVICPASTKGNSSTLLVCKHAGGSYRDIPNSDAASCCAACVADSDTPCAGWILAGPSTTAVCHLKLSRTDIVADPNPSSPPTDYCGLVRNISGPPRPPGPPGPPPPAPPPSPPAPPAPPDAKNVLLIVSDDMRPDLPMYGNAIVAAPNLQRIADQGVTFNQAHIQISYCCPSRNSFMSGRRPDTSQVWNFLTNWRQAGTSVETKAKVKQFIDLPQWFNRKGYWTAGTGKTWHNGVGYNPSDDWSDLTNFPYKFSWGGRECCLDINNTNITISYIQHAAKLKQPFFITQGFIRPHLPWQYPPSIKEEFYPEYLNGSKVVPPAGGLEPAAAAYPQGTTPIAWHQCAEMAVPSLEVGFTAAEVSAKRLEYFNAITFVDQQIGRLLDTLAEEGVANHTAILFLGDHGWQLGEHNMWCKMSVFDLGTRIPLLVSAPWLSQTHGSTTQAFAEAVDIFPTLADMAGVPVPASEGLQGKSLLPVLKSPATATVHKVALSQFPRCWQNETQINNGRKCGDERNQTNSPENMCDCHWAPAKYINFMGYSMRTDMPFPLRYTEWVRWNASRPIWAEVFARELYNHTGDTGTAFETERFENVNLAADTANQELMAQLSNQMHREFDQYMLED